MYSILRSISLLLVLMGVGSFVMPKFNRDSWVWRSLGSNRNPVMILSIIGGVGLFILSYRMQMAQEREEAARRRAAREESARLQRAATVDEELEEQSPAEYSREEVPVDEVPDESPAPALPESEWSLPETSTEDEEAVEAGSIIVTKSSEEKPEVVAEYSPVAEYKAGSESVVIEKQAADPANRPLEKSPSAIMQPVSEKRVRSAPAFEEDPESIFDELPQKPPEI